MGGGCAPSHAKLTIKMSKNVWLRQLFVLIRGELSIILCTWVVAIFKGGQPASKRGRVPPPLPPLNESLDCKDFSFPGLPCLANPIIWPQCSDIIQNQGDLPGQLLKTPFMRCITRGCCPTWKLSIGINPFVGSINYCIFTVWARLSCAWPDGTKGALRR